MMRIRISFILGIFALLTACIEGSGDDEVRETGYIECQVGDDCPDGLICSTPDGATVCAETQCAEATCACFGDDACGANRVCRDTAEGFACEPPEPRYVSCEGNVEACGNGGVLCRAPEGFEECLPNDGERCIDRWCECYGAVACGSVDQCVSNPVGLQCQVTPDATAAALSVVNACAAQGDANGLDLSVVISNASGESLSDAELSDPQFSIEPLPGRRFMGPEPVEAEAADGMLSGLPADPVSIDYVQHLTPGDLPLLIFALDNSGSLIGENGAGPPDLTQASDVRDDRIILFRSLLGQIDQRAFVSVMSFQDQLPVFDDSYSVPTQNRDISADGLTELERGAQGTTPLARTLTDIQQTIIRPNADLIPTVVLFTDGTEDGDPTDNATRDALQAAIASYAAAQIRVIVLQLKPPAAAQQSQTRDPLLMELACATGGAYFFLEDPDEFTDARRDLARDVLLALDGSWRMRLNLGLAALNPGAYALTALLSVQTGDARIVRDLAQPAEPDGDDTRLWIQR